MVQVKLSCRTFINFSFCNFRSMFRLDLVWFGRHCMIHVYLGCNFRLEFTESRLVSHQLPYVFILLHQLHPFVTWPCLFSVDWLLSFGSLDAFSRFLYFRFDFLHPLLLFALGVFPFFLTLQTQLFSVTNLRLWVWRMGFVCSPGSRIISFFLSCAFRYVFELLLGEGSFLESLQFVVLFFESVLQFLLFFQEIFD